MGKNTVDGAAGSLVEKFIFPHPTVSASIITFQNTTGLPVRTGIHGINRAVIDGIPNDKLRDPVSAEIFYGIPHNGKVVILLIAANGFPHSAFSFHSDTSIATACNQRMKLIQHFAVYLRIVCFKGFLRRLCTCVFCIPRSLFIFLQIGFFYIRFSSLIW